MSGLVNQSNPIESKSKWITRAAWASTGAIIAWALLSVFVLKPQNVSLLHLFIWGLLMAVNFILFVVGFILTTFNFYRLRKTVDAVTKRALHRQILWSLPGLLLALLSVVFLVFLIISVAQALFVVH